ncbi:hypothetical protein KDW_23650 [Dictyobacter vulcani]|uniref:Uncharacterized protein n=2 Tax=Dictyobacter vulcani TaxID=2607529 RepID=A0A5J4KKA0_9CHLR|nr:hypothetical protein KDW_23650 [Dictyobacter vulcani]
MARLKKILLINSNKNIPPTQQQLPPIKTDDLPWDVFPVTDEFATQYTDWDKELSQPVPAARSRTQELSLPARQNHQTRLIRILIFTFKHLIFALDALVLAALSYLCFKDQRPYLFLCWYVILIFWGCLAIPPVRHLLQRTGQTITRLCSLARGQHADTASNLDRSPRMRKLQDDTGAYMQALRRMHRTGRH